MRVTKNQIIEAISTESLIGGAWFYTKDCAVCAVGAVLRRCLNIKDREIAGVANEIVNWPEHRDIELVLKRKDWLSALSSFFEQEWESRDVDLYEGKKHEELVALVRKRTIEFVEHNFPDEIEIAL